MFRSILFPPGLESNRAESADAPACFVDLNLDQIVSAIVARRDEAVLRPILHSPCRNEEIVRYRQAVFADLEVPDILKPLTVFCGAMRLVRANLAYLAKISQECHRQMVLLRAATVYCDAVESLLNDLQSLAPRSAGLLAFRAYLSEYVALPAFRQLARETRDLRQLLSEVSYGMLFRGDKVTVRKYASEPDYTATVIERFARFRSTRAEAASSSRLVDDFSLNHIEEGILERVGRLFPDQFGRLGAYAARYAAFIDEVVAGFDREIAFFVAYSEFTDIFRRAGLAFCYPDVSVTSKDIEVVDGFDLALAAKLVRNNEKIICNSFRLAGAERLIVVSGPNQGGKTTFARMFGQLHFLAGLGGPVPGRSARLFLPDRLFTHFEREENISNLRGKLEDDLVRLHETCQTMTSGSVVILNEIFNSTSLDDQVFLSTKVLERVLAADALGVCVTFLDMLSTLSQKTVSMVSTVDPDDPSSRTFRIVRRPADGLAYALSLAQKHGVTYGQLRGRVRP
jgi:DNA mismatch repair protein MutS